MPVRITPTAETMPTTETQLTITQASKLAKRLTSGEVSLTANTRTVTASRKGYRYKLKFPRRELTEPMLQSYLESWAEWPAD